VAWRALEREVRVSSPSLPIVAFKKIKPNGATEQQTSNETDEEGVSSVVREVNDRSGPERTALSGHAVPGLFAV